MINRVLIRIKVVQLLYSYLLVENSFSLESQPDQPTREKRFAYGLYLDMLCLMVDIADGITLRGRGKPLYETRFIKRLASDDRIKSLRSKYRAGGFPFAMLEDSLADEVKQSALYKKFLKSEGTPADERIWQDIFKLIIMRNAGVAGVIANMENHTMSGVERMEQMMENTFSNFFASTDNLPDALATLRRSMDKARELYLRLLQLPMILTDMRERDIEESGKKFLATDEDRNPNLRFVENEYVAALRRNEELDNALDKIGRNISDDDEPMLRALLKAIMASDIYKAYMEFPATDLKRDCEFWRDIYKNVIFINPDFLQMLEDRSVFWNDDLDILGTFVMKGTKRIGDGNESGMVLPMYKDEEDARFGAELFTAVVKNKVKYREYIDEALDKNLWESERLAYMDVVVVMTALAEILNFPKIPLSVSINEYIEIAKAYSTVKSGQFVNGLLHGIVTRLQQEGLLNKH